MGSPEVGLGGSTTLAVAAVDPTPLALDAVQATSTMNRAHTPAGLRLVQVEARPHSTSVERLHGEVHVSMPRRGAMIASIPTTWCPPSSCATSR